MMKLLVRHHTENRKLLLCVNTIEAIYFGNKIVYKATDFAQNVWYIEICCASDSNFMEGLFAENQKVVIGKWSNNPPAVDYEPLPF